MQVTLEIAGARPKGFPDGFRSTVNENSHTHHLAAHESEET